MAESLGLEPRTVNGSGLADRLLVQPDALHYFVGSIGAAGGGALPWRWRNVQIVALMIDSPTTIAHHDHCIGVASTQRSSVPIAAAPGAVQRI